MSLRDKDLEVQSLFFFNLAPFCCKCGLWDGGFCFVPAPDPNFVPIKKSSLTRARPREGSFPYVMAFSESSDVGGSGGPFSKRARRGAPPSCFGHVQRTKRYTSRVNVGHPPFKDKPALYFPLNGAHPPRRFTPQ
jgi:hypothetical protein